MHPSGTKTWTSRVRGQGRDLDLSLGEWPEVGLEEARRRHEENRRLAREGWDPRRPTEMRFRNLWADWLKT
ncbi:MAG: Arm DNA-binding domain-containing protein [Desulfovibrio sp.]|nr:Arm DNA-binding domain-containing protein [Desulfovibrio sp.]